MLRLLSQGRGHCFLGFLRPLSQVGCMLTSFWSILQASLVIRHHIICAVAKLEVEKLLTLTLTRGSGTPVVVALWPWKSAQKLVTIVQFFSSKLLLKTLLVLKLLSHV